MQLNEEPRERVIHDDRGNNANQIRDDVVWWFDVRHAAGVVVQPRLTKERVPSEPDEEMDDDKNPHRKVMNFVIHSSELELSGGCKFRGKCILIAMAK